MQPYNFQDFKSDYIKKIRNYQTALRYPYNDLMPSQLNPSLGLLDAPVELDSDSMERDDADSETSGLLM